MCHNFASFLDKNRRKLITLYLQRDSIHGCVSRVDAYLKAWTNNNFTNNISWTNLVATLYTALKSNLWNLFIGAY